MKNFNLLSKVLLVGIVIVATSCDSILDVSPPDQLSETTFFQTESDARLALAGVYSVGNQGQEFNSFWKYGTYIRLLDAVSDNGNDRDGDANTFNDGTLNASDESVEELWADTYMRIARANNFLANVGSVDMNEDKKNEMIAEVKFIRAYGYFWLSQLWGGVPLVTEVLTLDEANSVSRESKDTIVDFVLNELTEAANNLPQTRPESEHGRILKSAALALRGRLLMAEQNWSDAAATYKQIIDMGVHSIDPRWKELFEKDGELSNEIIYSIKVKSGGLGSWMQRVIGPFQYGGWQQVNVFANLLKDFEMTDGNTIDESPMFDPQNRYENRDPRLDMSFFIPERTVFKGDLFILHPDSSANIKLTSRDFSGIHLKKFADEDFEGSVTNYGGDFPIIRYSEVLLSYLESLLESGQSISQSVLDETINQVRGREAVNMPPITTTNINELRGIVRSERRVEIAFEGLRYFDLLRWGIAAERLKGKFYGMQLTTDPDIISTGMFKNFEINDEGLFFYRSKAFKEGINERWPIPQSEIDINPNLEQNPGY